MELPELVASPDFDADAVAVDVPDAVARAEAVAVAVAVAGAVFVAVAIGNDGVGEGVPLTLTVKEGVAVGVPVGLAPCDSVDVGVDALLDVPLTLNVNEGVTEGEPLALAVVVRVCAGVPLVLTVVEGVNEDVPLALTVGEGVADGVIEPLIVLVSVPEGVRLGDCVAVIEPVPLDVCDADTAGAPDRLATEEGVSAAEAEVAPTTTTDAMSTEPLTAEGGMPAPAANAALNAGLTGCPAPYACCRSSAVPKSPTTATPIEEPPYVASTSARAAPSSPSARAAVLGNVEAEKGPPPEKGAVEPGAATNVMYTLAAGTFSVAATCSRSAFTATGDVADETITGAVSAVA